jgi:hypothetical protein
VIEKPVVLHPPPLEPVAIVDWNLDDKPLNNLYGGYSWSANELVPIYNYPTNITVDGAGFGVGGSVGWFLKMDNSTLGANPPAWAGGGTGGSGPVDLTRFDTGDMTSYRVSFAAKALGLDPSVTQTTCRLQIFLDSPIENLRLDFPVMAGTDWITNVMTLNQGSAGAGTKAGFTTNYNTYTGLRTQWQIENATSTDWGYDTDNALVLDNIKLERLYVACPPLIITRNADTITVTWAAPSTGTAKLQATSLNGSAWADVANATSPYSTTVPTGPKYFRLLWVPPSP